MSTTYSASTGQELNAAIAAIDAAVPGSTACTITFTGNITIDAALGNDLNAINLATGNTLSINGTG